MRKFAICFSLVAVFLVCVAAYTGFQTIRLTPSSSDTYTIDSRNTSGTTTFSVTPAGLFTGVVTREINLPLGSFCVSGEPVASTTAPGMEVGADGVPEIVWADGETTPAIVTFRVPPEYSSGGSFRVFATETDSTTPNQVDFDVFVNEDGAAYDASATGQTPVALAGTTTTPDMITLTPETDFDSLAAGDFVTLRIWRDNVAAGTGDLNVKNVSFRYTASR